MKMVTINFAIDPGDNDTERAMLRAVNADKAYQALDEIRSQIFRPARKHGYDDSVIAKLISRLDAASSFDESSESLANTLIGELERLYAAILEDNGINMDHEA